MTQISNNEDDVTGGGDGDGGGGLRVAAAEVPRRAPLRAGGQCRLAAAAGLLDFGLLAAGLLAAGLLPAANLPRPRRLASTASTASSSS